MLFACMQSRDASVSHWAQQQQQQQPHYYQQYSSDDTAGRGLFGVMGEDGTEMSLQMFPGRVPLPMIQVCIWPHACSGLSMACVV